MPTKKFNHPKHYKRIVKSPTTKKGIDIITPFFLNFQSEQPPTKVVGSEYRWQYRNFKISARFKNKRLFFVYIKRPDDIAGLNFLKQHGFGDMIAQLEKNSYKIGQNKKTRARIYFFDDKFNYQN